MNKISDLKVGYKVALKKGSVDVFIGRHRGCGGAILENNHHAHDEKIDWQKTTELNNKQMRELKIEVPKGYEIDKEKSTFEKIVFKEIGFKFPESVEEIPNREWFIDQHGFVSLNENKITAKDKNNLSSKERAEAFLALMQLVELRDYVNGDWKADFTKINRKYCINLCENKINKSYLTAGNCPLHFKSEEIRDQFAEKYKDLIETAKELL